MTLNQRFLQCAVERIDVAGTGLERWRVEDLCQLAVGPREHARSSTFRDRAQFGTELIPVQEREWHGKRRTKRAKFVALANATMSDIAETAVGRASPPADDVSELTAEPAVGVVDSDELRHGRV